MPNSDVALVKLRASYWREFAALLKRRDASLAQLMKDGGWMGREAHYRCFGRGDAWLETIANVRPPNIGVWLSLDGDDAEATFVKLEAERKAIEREVGAALEWGGKKPNIRAIRIKFVWHSADPRIRTQWPKQHDWLCNTLVAFHHAFGARLQ